VELSVPGKVKFYLNGGGLFTVQGRWWDDQVESLLSELGAEVYNPWRESKEKQLRADVPAEELRKEVFALDRTGVDISQGVIMLGEGAAGEVSSGTAWETGYAYARNKPIICMRTDLRGELNRLLKECLFDGRVCDDLGTLRERAASTIERLTRLRAAPTSYDPPTRPRNIDSVFLSAPYYTAAEEAFARELERHLSGLGLDVMFPQGVKSVRAGLSSGRQGVWSALFKEKVRCLDKCDAVVAMLEGADCSSETGWDCGYGYSKYKPVFGMRTDFRTLGDIGGRVNLMIEQSLVDSRLSGSASEVGQMVGAWH
jgi:nucleoside 2-deoxyribosyltransferase